MESWMRFRRLSASERRVVVSAAVALVATRLALRLAGFRFWKAALDFTFPRQISADIRMPATVESVVRFEAAAARHLFFRANCLERSLALWWMLRRQGVPANLRLGAQKATGAFEAHAWVELNGVVLNDPSGTHLGFTPFGSPIAPVEWEPH